MQMHSLLLFLLSVLASVALAAAAPATGGPTNAVVCNPLCGLLGCKCPSKADITTTVSETTTATQIVTTMLTAAPTTEFSTITAITTITKPTAVFVTKAITSTITIPAPCPPPVTTTETKTIPTTTTAKTTQFMTETTTATATVTTATTTISALTITRTSTAVSISTTTDINISTLTTTRTVTPTVISSLITTITDTEVSTSTTTRTSTLTTTFTSISTVPSLVITNTITLTTTGLPTSSSCKGTYNISKGPKTTQTLHFDDLTAVSIAGPLPSVYRGLHFQYGFQIIKGGALPLGLPPSSPNAIFFNPHLPETIPIAVTGDGRKFGLLSFRIAGCFSYIGGDGEINDATVPKCKLRLEGYGQGRVSIFTTEIPTDRYTTVLMPPAEGFGEGLFGLRWSVYLQIGEKIAYGQFLALDNIALANEGDGVSFCDTQ